MALYMGPPAGLLAAAFWGWVMTLVGRLLGGRGDVSAARVALACGTLPELLTLPLVAALIGYRGTAVLTQADAAPRALRLSILAIEVVVIVWGFILRAIGFGEMFAFSVWRAFLAALLGWFLVVSAAVGLVLGAMAIWK
jgi:hypothetical protein